MIDSKILDGSDTVGVLILPTGARIIDNDCFNNSNVTAIITNKELETIGVNAFKNSKKLEALVLNSDSLTISDYSFANCASLKSVIFCKGIKSIGEYSFSSCTSLHNVELPFGLTKIRSFAFELCSSLHEISIPSSVNEINRFAFNNCARLTQVILPSSVREVGDRAFAFCHSLRTVEITSPIKIGSEVFYGCNKLSRVKFSSAHMSINPDAFDNTNDFSVNICGIQMSSDTFKNILLEANCNADKLEQLLKKTASSEVERLAERLKSNKMQQSLQPNAPTSFFG